MIDEYSMRSAQAADAPEVSALVAAAYSHYVERIGGPPGPMTLDYRRVIADGRTTLAVAEDEVVGLLVLSVDAAGLCISNIAVHPAHQGRGLGRRLLALAEEAAGRTGSESIYLYTHELMTENLAWYTRLGYVEYARRDREGATLVFLRKVL